MREKEREGEEGIREGRRRERIVNSVTPGRLDCRDREERKIQTLNLCYVSHVYIFPLNKYYLWESSKEQREKLLLKISKRL